MQIDVSVILDTYKNEMSKMMDEIVLLKAQLTHMQNELNKVQNVGQEEE